MPGRIGWSITRQVEAEGYAVATRGRPRPHRAAIEVFPHAALLGLLARNYRVPYKVSRSNRYWRGQSVRERIALLLEQFGAIHRGLTRALGPLGFALPAAPQADALASLKRYEDALDALVCAWVGSEYLAGRISAYGDGSAAIWVPASASGHIQTVRSDEP